MNKHIVFVYGSLKQGFGNHTLLKRADFLGEHTTKHKYTMLNLGGHFPGIIEYGNTPIKGELYAVTGDELIALDGLEGYFEGHPESSLYIRKTIGTPLGNSYIYILNPMYQDTVVEDGDWQIGKRTKREGILS